MRKEKTRRTIEITIERSEFFVIPRRSEPMLAWCDGCGKQVPFATPQEAAVAFGASVRAIFRKIEAAEVHLVETDDERLLVCLESLVLSCAGLCR